MEAEILRLPTAPPPLRLVTGPADAGAAPAPAGPVAVLFASCDAAPGFRAVPVFAGRLEAAIATAFDLDGGNALPEVAREIGEIAEMLRKGGSCAFHGGWLTIAATLPAATDFLMGRLGELAATAAEAERRSAEAMSRANAWEAKYRHLALVVREAFEPRERDLVAALGAMFGADKITVMEG